jgi:hypothetical protein
VRRRQPKVSCETRSRRQPRETRTATVECRACSVTLRAPYRPDRKLPDVTVNAVRVREVTPPKDEEPIEWLPLTSLPITNAEQALRVILFASRAFGDCALSLRSVWGTIGRPWNQA